MFVELKTIMLNSSNSTSAFLLPWGEDINVSSKTKRTCFLAYLHLLLLKRPDAFNYTKNPLYVLSVITTASPKLILRLLYSFLTARTNPTFRQSKGRRAQTQGGLMSGNQRKKCAHCGRSFIACRYNSYSQL